MADEKRNYEARIQEQLEERRREIEKLKKEADNLRKEVQDDFRSEVEILEGKQSMLEHDVKVLRENTGEAWESIREGLDKSWQTLSEGIQRLRKDFQ